MQQDAVAIGKLDKGTFFFFLHEKGQYLVFFLECTYTLLLMVEFSQSLSMHHDLNIVIVL